MDKIVGGIVAFSDKPDTQTQAPCESTVDPFYPTFYPCKSFDINCLG